MTVQVFLYRIRYIFTSTLLSSRVVEATVAQQCVYARFASAEGFEGFRRAAGAADGEDFLPEAFACGGDVVAFFKGGVGVGAEDFRPCVAVIACGVAAGEDVAEAVGEAVVFGRLDDGDFFAHAV